MVPDVDKPEERRDRERGWCGDRQVSNFLWSIVAVRETDDEAEEVGCRRALRMARVSWPEVPGVLLFVSILIASSAPAIGADGQS